MTKKITSVYTADQKRLMSISTVAREVAAGAPTEKGILKRIKKLGLSEKVISPVQIVEVEEIAKLISGAIMHEARNKPWERFYDERDLAESTTLRTIRSIYGTEQFLVKSWIPGVSIRYGGDIFELTGEKCQKCKVNPEAYGHGGGIRCLDTENCGYSFCY